MNFSVVTPSFAQLEWLELCVASVRDQVAFTDIEGSRVPSAGLAESSCAVSVEHIVCDGGTEGVEEFKRRMQARFPDTAHYRLRFLIGRDEGMYDAINKGMSQAEGKICSYLNCDEQVLPGALSAVWNRFTQSPSLDVLFGDTIVVDIYGGALCYWRPYVPTLRHLSGASLNTLSCSTFFRRDVIEAGHLFDRFVKVVGDMLWIRGLLKAKRKMACVPRPLAAFTFSGDNLGASSTAHHEFQKSRASNGWLSGLRRRAVHGARKLLSGAYVRRRVTYEIFTTADPSRRQRFHVAALGCAWPSAPQCHVHS